MPVASAQLTAGSSPASAEISANIVITLAERGPDSTELTVHTDANVLGRLGEFGQPVMRKKADTIMKEFAENISRRVAARS